MTCMYNEMKRLACRFKTSYAKVFDQIGDLLRKIYDIQRERMEKLAKEIKQMRGEAKRRAEKQLKDIKEDVARMKVMRSYIVTISFIHQRILLQREVGKYTDWFSKPANWFDQACDSVGSAFADAGNWMKDAGESAVDGLKKGFDTIGGWFGRRKRGVNCNIKVGPVYMLTFQVSEIVNFAPL